MGRSLSASKFSTKWTLRWKCACRHLLGCVVWIDNPEKVKKQGWAKDAVGHCHKKGLNQPRGSWDASAESINIKARRTGHYTPAWSCGWFQGRRHDPG